MSSSISNHFGAQEKCLKGPRTIRQGRGISPSIHPCRHRVVDTSGIHSDRSQRTARSASRGNALKGRARPLPFSSPLPVGSENYWSGDPHASGRRSAGFLRGRARRGAQLTRLGVGAALAGEPNTGHRSAENCEMQSTSCGHRVFPPWRSPRWARQVNTEPWIRVRVFARRPPGGAAPRFPAQRGSWNQHLAWPGRRDSNSRSPDLLVNGGSVRTFSNAVFINYIR